MCHSPKSQKDDKTLILVYKVVQGHCFQCQSKARVWLSIKVYFLTVTLKIFSTLLFIAFDQGDFFRILDKALRILELESSREGTVKIW